VVKIGSEGRVAREEGALSFVSDITVGLDLTLRDVQNELKKKGFPWEIAKAFEQSGPIGNFVSTRVGFLWVFMDFQEMT